MAVQVWIGEKPENPNERRAIIALASGLDRLDGLYVMLANFSVGGHTVDLVILKRDAIFILELKHCDGRVFGAVNGPWTVVSRSGSTKHLNPGRKNPYNQVISYFYSFTNFLNDHKAEIVSAQKAPDIDFRTAKRVIVIVPTLEEGSQIELDWKVQVKGLDELPTYLVVERSAGIELSDQALQRIPKMLRCEPWKEVTDLLKGVMPAWDDTPSDPVPAASRPAIAAPAPVAAAEPRTVRQRVQNWLAGAVTAFALGTLIYGVAVRPTGPSELDTSSGAFVASSTVGPIPTIPERGISLDINNGVAELHDRVGRRWDAIGQRWNLERAEDAEVLVTLETVNFNDGAIRLTFTVENRRQQDITMPLRGSNFDLTDVTGLAYRIDERLSQPGEVVVKPGAKATATVVVSQPVQPSAMTLKVTIVDLPFGKTSWLVPVPENIQ